MPEPGSCASSGRTWRGALGGSTLPGGETGRPASASVARAYRLQSRRFHRRWLCRHKTTGKFFQHDETRSRRLLLHKAPSSSPSPSPSPSRSPSPSPGLILHQAILRDVLPLARREAVTSKIAIVRSTSPMIAPIVGSLILSTLGWRA